MTGEPSGDARRSRAGGDHSPLRGISSMATRHLLAERVAAFNDSRGEQVTMLSVGGVDAARRVRDGEPFDVVVLAADAISTLVAGGHVRADEVREWVASDVAIAVRAGAARPSVSTGADVRDAVVGAASIGVSTGPSGVALSKLFGSWDTDGAIGRKTVQAPPGVPVGSLVASGEVALGFQQYSELMDVPGIDVLGMLPPDIRISTVFCAAICSLAADPVRAAAFLFFLVDPDADETTNRHGMRPARLSVQHRTTS